MNSFTFGGSSAQPSTGFGAPASGHSAAGTLFGGASNTGFGATANNNAAGSSAGTLFGKPAAGTSAGTLFGTTPTTSSGAFGFGSNTAAPASAAPAASGFGTTSTATGFGGGFGNTQQQAPATSMPSFGGGFGNTQQQAPATSTPSFGGGLGTSAGTINTSQAPTTTFSGFGNNAQQQQAKPAAAGGFSGFGMGGFGNTQAQQQQQQKPAFGGFGGTGGGFGSTAPSTGFGGFGNTQPQQQQQQQQPSTGGFGSNTFGSFGQQKPNTGFGFGQQPSNAFGQQPSNAFGQPQQAQPQPQQPQYNVWQQLALIKAHWDPTSPLCQFRHYFYNTVPPNEVQLYVRPPNQDEQLWNEAQQKNPDPSCMVPVLAVGFEDVLKRMNIQDQQSELHKEKLEELDQRLETVQRKYDLASQARLDEHKRRHADLTQRVIRLLRVVQVIRYKGFPLNPQEELCQKQFEALSTQPNNPEQLYTKMLELWSQLHNIKNTRPQTADSHWEALNENDTMRIANILGDEQEGLKHVTDMLTKDLESVKALEANLKLEAKNKENKQPLSI
ncbi:hypothetical protein [Absidia glauca]|uniref:Nucleoporin Nup54 alpha-helical domain-containing protein n=1 Tax=Absidia glauca TaxID=4829 RepID=A0A168S4F1_ABSGL|nr:hypothetical protein [Absidia glauca]